MRRLQLLSALVLLPAAAALMLAGCSGGDKKGTNPPAANPTPTPPAKTDGKTTETPGKGNPEAKAGAYDGVIKGTVKAGDTKEEDLSPVMAKHADKDVCLAAPEDQKVAQEWIVGKNGGLANVVVYLKPASGKFDVSEDAKAAFKKPAVLDQPFCAFVPHVVALYPDAGQELVVRNSAKVPHNTNLQGNPLKNPPKNVTLKPGSEETIKVKHQDAPLNVKCDLHTWMSAKVKTFDHPYFAVTDKDGNFEIKNAPTGVEVTVMTWHEKAGDQQMAKTFKSGENTLDAITLTKK